MKTARLYTTGLRPALECAGQLGLFDRWTTVLPQACDLGWGVSVRWTFFYMSLTTTTFTTSPTTTT